MNFGSLFAGIGGIDLGLERAGMTCKWQVEIDDFCNKVLEKHWPEVKRYRDVREVGIANLEPVDLIAGGFPCQPHSVAGKRRGKDDDRNLWPEYLRIIREIKPRWVVGENVPGIITTMLDDVLSDLDGAGYAPTVFNIPAAAFGANHLRYRIIVVAKSGTMGSHGSNGIQSSKGRVDMAAQEQSGNNQQGKFEPDSKNLANAKSGQSRLQTESEGWQDISGGSKEVGNFINPNNWSIEPNVGRVANGVPNRVDRLKSLGNAVVPQVAEYIGRCIMEAENETI